MIFEQRIVSNVFWENASNNRGLTIFQIEPNPFIYEYAMNGEWRETYI